MKTYARIENGAVVEIFVPMVDGNGNEIPIEQRLHPDIVATLVDITGTDVEAGWIVTDAGLVPPPPPIPDPGPTFAELMAAYLKNELQPLYERVLARLLGIMCDAMYDGDNVLAGHARMSRQAIKDLPNHAAVTAAMAAENYEAVRDAYKLAYDEARAAADPSVVSAFKALDV